MYRTIDSPGLGGSDIAGITQTHSNDTNDIDEHVPSQIIFAALSAQCGQRLVSKLYSRIGVDCDSA